MSELEINIIQNDIIPDIIKDKLIENIRIDKVSLCKKFARIAIRDIKRFSFLLLFCMFALASYHAFMLKYYDIRDYYAYQGTTGPFEYIEPINKDAKATAGKNITNVMPGQKFAWVTNFCLNSGITIQAHFSFVRIAQSGMIEIPIDSRDSVNNPDSKRCGPAVNSWSVPADALPGVYEVRRKITIKNGFWYPLYQDFEPIRIIVAPKNNILLENYNIYL